MKKSIIIVLLAIIITMLLFIFACQAPAYYAPSNKSPAYNDSGSNPPISDPTSDPNALDCITYRDMIDITGGTYDQYDSDYITYFNHTISGFQIAKYEITYELWYTVRQWALSNGYTFANAGREGSAGGTGTEPTGAKYEPVTTVSWNDAIVWCNAYSEMSGLTPCYTYSSAIIKDSSDSKATVCDNTVCNWSASGYRLPTEGEWQFATSNKGGTPNHYLSGATTFYNNITSTSGFSGEPGKSANDAVAVYKYYWNGSWIDNGTAKTANVGTKNANQLAIFDMSGNVLEWCWDWSDNYPVSAVTDYKGPDSGLLRLFRGGAWNYNTHWCRVSFRYNYFPDTVTSNLGFRVARSAPYLSSSSSSCSSSSSSSFCTPIPDPSALNCITFHDMTSITGITDNSYIQYTNNGSGFIHNISSFMIGKYEVTYELWHTVYQWSISNGYTFVHPGREGDHGTNGAPPTAAKYQPVTMIDWREAIVWCNAYSEMFGLTPCYTYSNAIIKDSSPFNAAACDNAVCNWSANGYRLPTEGEWQFAASNRGLTPYNYASGASTFYNDIADVNPANGVVDGKDANDAVALYLYYWDGDSWAYIRNITIANVYKKSPNELGLYLMSGNVEEWCWDWNASYPGTAMTDYRGPANGDRTGRVCRGGSISSHASGLQVSFRYKNAQYVAADNLGFRVARSVF